MVDFFSFDPSFTSWTPSIEEFQSFTENNKYYNAKANLSTPVTTDSLPEATVGLPPAPVHSYTLKMTKRIISVDHQESSMSFTMEETRTEIERDESKCPICAVELKERQFLLNYQKLKENSKIVRNMCMRKEHPGTCHICTKHRPFEPSEGIPRCLSDASRLSYQRRLFAQQLPIPAMNYNRGPVNLCGQPISVPGYNYYRGPVDLNGYPISVPGINCELKRSHLIGQPNSIHSMNSEPKPVNHIEQSVPAVNSDSKLSVPKETFKPKTQDDSASAYQFGLKIGSYSVQEDNKPKPFEPADQTIDWYNYYQQPDVHTVRMAYTKSFDKLNEKSDNFPGKRMAAKFDIDDVKSDN
ncbi:hypothetical protein CBL_06405 [Carabus blaptoides fortunei]